MPLEVRFLTDGGEEASGRITNVSGGGAFVESETRLGVGDGVVLYADTLGRFEAVVVRLDEAGFAVRFSHKAARAKRLCDSLTFLLNKGPGGAEKRQARRFPQNEPARMVLPDGTLADCRILDISTTGASVGIENRPEIGAEIRVGRMAGRVVRHHEEGIGVLFLAAPAAAEDEGPAAGRPARSGRRGEADARD